MPPKKLDGLDPETTARVDLQAGATYAACVQYTLRNIPPSVDEALRAKARAEGKSLNDVALEALLVGLGLTGQPVKHRDLSDIAGSWVSDPVTDEALLEQRRIDPELWRVERSFVLCSRDEHFRYS